jgi:hypothetical protein
VWSWIGAVLALAGTLLAASRAWRPGVSYYESQVYHMTRRSHLRFAAVSALFVLLFAAGGLEPRVPAVPLLAVYTVLIVLYGASFVRGASGEDEL